MTSAAQLEANRLNAQRSTGPRTAEGRARSSQNAVKHGFTGRLLVGLQYGPFADNAEDLERFVEAVLAELGPRSEQERAETCRSGCDSTSNRTSASAAMRAGLPDVEPVAVPDAVHSVSSRAVAHPMDRGTASSGECALRQGDGTVRPG